MDTSQKLKIIQQLSSLTQTELARLLDVSFPTLNSWINGKSTPRKNKAKAIDELYSKYTGQTKIPSDSTEAKRDIILRKLKKHKNIIGFIKGRTDIYDQLVLSFTYNTNSIEGSTLTENETAGILFEGITIKNKDLVEQLEAKNHQAALNFLFDELKPGYKITEAFVLKLHRILMTNIHHDAGVYRNHGVRIVGSHVPTTNPMKVPSRMEALLASINKVPPNVVAHVAGIHAEFEQIHPFSDGNGRVGRLIMAAMLLRSNLAPAIVKKEKKQRYYECLQRAQLKSEYTSLEAFLYDAILDGFKILDV